MQEKNFYCAVIINFVKPHKLSRRLVKKCHSLFKFRGDPEYEGVVSVEGDYSGFYTAGVL